MSRHRGIPLGSRYRKLDFVATVWGSLASDLGNLTVSKPNKRNMESLVRLSGAALPIAAIIGFSFAATYYESTPLSSLQFSWKKLTDTFYTDTHAIWTGVNPRLEEGQAEWDKATISMGHITSK